MRKVRHAAACLTALVIKLVTSRFISLLILSPVCFTTAKRASTSLNARVRAHPHAIISNHIDPFIDRSIAPPSRVHPHVDIHPRTKAGDTHTRSLSSNQRAGRQPKKKKKANNTHPPTQTHSHMAGKPDWMNFGEEDSIESAPPPFMNATAADASNTTTAAPAAQQGDDIPLFLRDDAAGLPGVAAAALHGSTPAFLSGMLDSEGRTAQPAAYGNAAAGGGLLSRPSTAGSASTTPGAAASTVMYADQPSAAVLNFAGDSGKHWALHRVRILGKGNYGCATLYSLDEEVSTAAAQPSPTRAVVVKDINVQTMLNPAEDMPAVQNELRVLRSAAGHPNLVQYVDALFDSRPASYPMCFIVMEYAAGGDLAALVERCGSAAAALSGPAASPSPFVHSDTVNGGGSARIAEDYVAAYLIQTAVALYSLHTEHGILHRDVKPHNIFLLEDGVTVRLGDFGISVQLGRVGEKAKEACGSPYFMAPEIFEEKAYDSAADVWALGVVFYQLLTHQLPFTASSVAALSAVVRRGTFAHLADATDTSSSPASTAAAAALSRAAAYSKELRELIDSLLTVEAAARPTLRRVLRSRYAREHLHCVPISVLQARRPLTRRAISAGGGAAAAPQFAEESLYASVFGAEAVAEAVARAVHPGVTPITDRILTT